MYTMFKSMLAGSFALLLVGLSSCSKNDKDNGYPDPGKGEDNGKGIQLKTDATFGGILTDGNGKTLYFFAKDANGTSGCTGGCLAAWPVYYSTNAKTVTGIQAGDVGEITRADGSKQNTYKGWPLYYYANDDAAGKVTGDGVGGNWFVAKADYSLMLVSNQLIGADGKHYTANLGQGDEQTTYFTDGSGRTLYAYAPDHFNQNTFTKEDFSNDAVWPIYQSDIGSLPSVLAKSDVGTITVFGKKQLTYKGWPLYYFGQDAHRGDNKGVSVPQPGVWPIANTNTAAAPQM